jgi:hypothetical protein
MGLGRAGDEPQNSSQGPVGSLCFCTGMYKARAFLPLLICSPFSRFLDFAASYSGSMGSRTALGVQVPLSAPEIQRLNALGNGGVPVSGLWCP